MKHVFFILDVGHLRSRSMLVVDITLHQLWDLPMGTTDIKMATLYINTHRICDTQYVIKKNISTITAVTFL